MGVERGISGGSSKALSVFVRDMLISRVFIEFG
jgi:hypothetical protein